MAKPEGHPVLLFTCEHGGNQVPRAYQHVFKGAKAKAALATHRGIDIGALAVSQEVVTLFKAPLIFATVTRLLVDLNRSPGHKHMLSEFSRELSDAEQERAIADHYWPYRHEVEAWIAKRVARGQKVIHISMHSFTPKLHGPVRNAEIGLLYDPRRAIEANGADLMHDALKISAGSLRVRRNYPYKGTADAFQLHLRRQFSEKLYAAFEIEMNQAVVGTAAGRKQMVLGLKPALEALLIGRGPSSTRSRR